MIEMKDVHIYVSSETKPVLMTSKLKLTESVVLKPLMQSLNICDGCQEPISIIIPDEDKNVVLAAFSKYFKTSGVSIIQGMFTPILTVLFSSFLDPAKVTSLASRLGLKGCFNSSPPTLPAPTFDKTAVVEVVEVVEIDPSALVKEESFVEKPPFSLIKSSSSSIQTSEYTEDTVKCFKIEDETCTTYQENPITVYKECPICHHKIIPRKQTDHAQKCHNLSVILENLKTKSRILKPGDPDASRKLVLRKKMGFYQILAENQRKYASAKTDCKKQRRNTNTVIADTYLVKQELEILAENNC